MPRIAERQSETPVRAASLGARKAAIYIDRSVWYLKDKRRHGGGPPFVRVGRSITYRIVDLDEWLAAHVVPAQPRTHPDDNAALQLAEAAATERKPEQKKPPSRVAARRGVRSKRAVAERVHVERSTTRQS